MNVLTNTSLSHSLEQAELTYWREYLVAASTFPETAPYFDRQPFGGEVVAGLCREHDILAFNRCLGLGLTTDLNPALLKQITAYYAQAGVPRFFVPVFPGTDTYLLEKHGFKPYNNWAKLVRRIHLPLKETPCPFRIRPATTADRDTFAQIVTTAFNWPDLLGYFFASTLGQPNWHHSIVMTGSKAVAVGALFIHGNLGVMAVAATLPEYRNRGAQNALIQHRIRQARELGCRYMSVETAESNPDAPSISCQNMLKQGFELAYLRPNYLKIIEK